MLPVIRYLVSVRGYLIGAAIAAAPFAARAAAHTSFTATDLLNNISTFIINPLIYILFSAAFVVFLWGLVQFVANLDSEEARSTGGTHMLWGMIGMALMVSVRGIIGIIQNTIQSLGS
ncbi:MAG: Uncharacterized protein Greene041679_38 [Parcubacteria group bacterium Greene0416_79]|nr:MAG: Uncharacterized protein Greene041679_38 [Parcubacteria group bacterium Greene0416_79]